MRKNTLLTRIVYLCVAVTMAALPLASAETLVASEPDLEAVFVDEYTEEGFETFTPEGEIPIDIVPAVEVDNLHGVFLSLNGSRPNVVVSPLDDVDSFLREMGYHFDSPQDQ